MVLTDELGKGPFVIRNKVGSITGEYVVTSVHAV